MSKKRLFSLSIVAKTIIMRCITHVLASWSNRKFIYFSYTRHFGIKSIERVIVLFPFDITKVGQKRGQKSAYFDNDKLIFR